MTARYSFAALADAMRLTEPEAARVLGLSGSTAQGYRRDGLSEKVADRLAVRAGFHAWSVWPEMVDAVIADAGVPCEECGELFTPTRKGHRFCQPACANRRRERVKKRERYRTDPAYRQRQLEYQRAYRASAKRAKALENRRYREANREALRAYKRAYYVANRERLLAQERARYHRSKKAA